MNKIIFVSLSFLIISCGISQKNADLLNGTWLLTEIVGDPTVIPADSIMQNLIFEPCNDAYTATCKVNYVYIDASPSTKDTVRLNITIKDNDLTFINSSIPSFAGTSNFNKIFKQKRFFIRELTQQSLHLERYPDSLSVYAIKQ